MGRKRKFSSEDEYRLEKSRRDRERYIKKVVQRKRSQSAETQTAIPETTEHNLFDVPIHDDLPPKHTVGCFCLDLPMFSLSDKTYIPSISAISAIDSCIILLLFIYGLSSVFFFS